ncbi:MAG: hypothetical protein K0041_09100, partial [Acidithiobacillus sp.]|nr:hypothetical protein [Acidithiobacillus sp.]
MSSTPSTTQGLTTAEAQAKLQQYGRNEIREEQPHLWLLLLRKFWAPVPWMLEITLILEIAL